MRSFIIALLATATLATPLMAQDQDQPGRERGRGYARPDGATPQQEERRAPQAQAPREARPAPQPAPQPSAAQQPQQRAQAAPNDPNRGYDRGDRGRGNRADDRAAGQPRGADPRFGQSGGDPRAQGQREQGNRDPRGGQFGRPGYDPRQNDAGRAGYDPRQNEGGRPGYADGRNNRQGWDRGWRNDRRYDWQDRRNADRSRFRAPRYYPPRGYGAPYRRWSVGARLQPFFFAQDYWLNDAGYYGLPPAYGPYRWVRYYDDVLLVTIRTGYVADVIPGFFL